MAIEAKDKNWVDNNRRMFGQIVRRYDLMNAIMSLGRDAAWRRATANFAAPEPCRFAFDMATGTGDLAFALAAKSDSVVGLDISAEMIEAAWEKERASETSGKVGFLVGDGLNLPFATASFDAAVSGFALRNVANLDAALSELHRVLRPGGRLACLELSKASFRPLGALHMAYIAGIVPLLGWLLAGNAGAYRFLSTSLSKFLTPEQLQQRLYNAGFRHVEYHLYQFRSIAIHVAYK
jgi:demethylmenaquinone methyltransferase/2-methoxy-6-polyprenyl-1,4-benzoquinol methylase